MASGWFLLGAPWDCSGTSRGEQAAPAQLRHAGLSAIVDVDAGDSPTVIDSSVRDPTSGVLALQETKRAALVLAESLSTALDDHPDLRPLVIGGDCSVLLGIVPSLRRREGRIGLCLIDGHPDYSTGFLSETGETADMELAILTGDGPEELTTLAGAPPMVEVEDAMLMGHRDTGLDEASAAELARLPKNLARISSDELLKDPRLAGEAALDYLAQREREFWLHLDLDVLDHRVLPAVTYPQPGGPDWAQLEAAMRPLIESPLLLGVSLADYRPDLDPDGELAVRIVDLIRRLILEP